MLQALWTGILGYFVAKLLVSLYFDGPLTLLTISKVAPTCQLTLIRVLVEYL